MHQAKLITSRSMQNSNHKVNLNVQFYSTIAKTKNLIIMATGFTMTKLPLISQNSSLSLLIKILQVNKITDIIYYLILIKFLMKRLLRPV